MRFFVLGAAFLMFIASLPADATNIHAIKLKAPSEPQETAFLQSFGETLPPIGYVNFCRARQDECVPSRRFADRVQLTRAKGAELAQGRLQRTLPQRPRAGRRQLAGRPEGRRAAGGMHHQRHR